ncbi:PREDICTED: uncharacterized protein LOC109179748 [Ipomoea nil]|uniref:uncharacterized protein LOC109179748 n=1 Tax=Ipomoea nil TaxID=35883 RepID=UPI00090141E9|nr:PREDICTED: uncharacterized protein LOC109179748 [Ipomoea nil]
MASSSRSLEEVCAALMLKEEEAGGIELEAEDVVENSECLKFAAVERLLTDQPKKFQIMRDTLAGAWRPGKGVTIKELPLNLMLFQFYHEFDLMRVLEDGPWVFEQNLVLIKRVEENQSLLDVELNVAEFWVQVHNLPLGFMSARVAEAVGNHIGCFVKADQRNFDGPWKTFMRVRVALNVGKPLKRKMKIKKPRGEWYWVEFKYERLPTFFFECGVLGHSERFCGKHFEVGGAVGEKLYGAWLRAPGHRSTATLGQ